LKVTGYGAIPVWDDGQYLLARAAVTDWWSTPWRARLLTPELGYPLPVPTFVYAHVRMLFPDHFPQILHGLNLALHLLNSLLVYRLARGWFDRRTGAAVMALWALHPVNVEAVAWLTNLKTLIAAGCVLGAILLWRRHLRRAADDSSDGPRHAPWLVAALVLVGLGCRPDAAIAAPVLALHTLRHGGLPALRHHARPIAALTTVAAAGVGLGIAGHGSFVDHSALERHTLAARLVRIGETAELSFTHLVWPLDSHPGYFVRPDATLLDALPGLATLATLLAAAAWLTWRAGWKAAFPVLLLVTFYLPYSNIRYLPRIAADTYQYLPSFAALLIAAATLHHLGDRLPPNSRLADRLPHIAAAAAVATTLAFAALTSLQIERWRNAETLWAPTLEAYPRVTRPYTMLGLTRVRDGDWQTARKLVDRALPLYRRARNYPFFLPLVYEETAAPDRAVGVARETIDRGIHLTPKHHKVFADVTARQNASFPTDDPYASAFDRALQGYRNRPTWMAARSDRLTMLDYLTTHRQFDRALRFLRRELRTDRPHCFTWTAADRLPDDTRTSLDLPNRPTRCRN
jgi:hypothetical protein